MQIFPHACQQLEKFIPVASDDRLIRTKLKLPYIHDVLIHLRQVSGLNIKRCYDINVRFTGFLAWNMALDSYVCQR